MEDNLMDTQGGLSVYTAEERHDPFSPDYPTQEVERASPEYDPARAAAKYGIPTVVASFATAIEIWDGEVGDEAAAVGNAASQFLAEYGADTIDTVSHFF